MTATPTTIAATPGGTHNHTSSNDSYSSSIPRYISYNLATTDPAHCDSSHNEGYTSYSHDNDSCHSSMPSFTSYHPGYTWPRLQQHKLQRLPHQRQSRIPLRLFQLPFQLLQLQRQLRRIPDPQLQ